MFALVSRPLRLWIFYHVFQRSKRQTTLFNSPLRVNGNMKLCYHFLGMGAWYDIEFVQAKKDASR